MSDMSGIRRTPQESAEHLASSLDNFTATLRRVLKRQKYIFVLIAVVIVSLAITVKFNYDGNVERCRSGNELRVDTDEKWDGIADFLEGAGTSESQDGKELLALLRDDLEQRDCSDINWLGK